MMIFLFKLALMIRKIICTLCLFVFLFNAFALDSYLSISKNGMETKIDFLADNNDCDNETEKEIKKELEDDYFFSLANSHWLFKPQTIFFLYKIEYYNSVFLEQDTIPPSPVV